ncbi:Hypothetical predicted protein [Cloeon dipterum]|uniref:Uncharacterized protein n=1 Tax=Cloeon dipterum TaxID=197152 RepID=A0A8S1E1L3_9INSE|nr:Hypothetical predicted protein [Cloeon dipterum]
MEKSSLFNLAVNSLFDNIDEYADKNLLKIIFERARGDILLKETLQIAKNHSHQNCSGEDDHVNKLWATLPVLVYSKNYVSFDTTDLMQMSRNCNNFCLSNSRFQDLIQCLASNTPNLRNLTIKGLPELALSLGERELASIIQLKSLQVLYIQDVSVSLSGVLAITRKCEKLEKIAADQVCMDVEPSSDAFRDDFVFVKINANNFQENRLGLTLQKTMPIEEFPNCAAFPRYTVLCIEPRKVADLKLLRGLTQITELKFSSFQLVDIQDLGEFPLLPEMRFAWILGGKRSAHALRRFLQINGLALRELTLKGISLSDEVTLTEVFNLCPNLNSLEFNDSDFAVLNDPIQAILRFENLNLNYDLDTLIAEIFEKAWKSQNTIWNGYRVGTVSS